MDVMRKEGVTVKELYIDRLSESLFEYLAAFSGLESLFLGHEDGFSHLQLDRSTSHDLFQHILPLHSKTLKTLILKARSLTSGLIFNEHTANPFKGCPNLTRCGITLLIDDAPRCLQKMVYSPCRISS